MVQNSAASLVLSNFTMVKRGSTTTKRGRKPAASVESNNKQANEISSPQQEVAIPKEALANKAKNSFRGKLSHTSPIQDSSSRDKKITVYFATVKLEEASKGEHAEIEKEVGQVAKSLALQRVFGKPKRPEKADAEISPHKILLEEETQQLVIESHGVSEKILKEEIAFDQSVKEPKVKAMKAKRKLNVNQSLNQDASPNHKLTEYFAVRRSVRKPKTAILEEKQRNLEESVLSGKEDGLQVHNFPGKGRGIVATRLFRRGEFVVEYSGDLIEMAEAREREKLYAADQNTGCYMYYFQHKNQSYCVDATSESHRLGRLVNHSRQSGNLMPKVIEIKDRPHLLLVARSDILPGEELLYDYGDRSRVSLKYHPWLAS
ncbi:Histone-lysine N-methyltransferase PR-set7 [Daphnia magna]|uniref:[histone H4]-lysine(20) N-methyltransferase n=1 Tax=Daphnia magna TaxID=35525 RepID=A0A0P5EEN7_9CRUS|nr:Histone-lysine N-methyltransferase PR-set7 [Daphnia magna]